MRAGGLETQNGLVKPRPVDTAGRPGILTRSLHGLKNHPLVGYYLLACALSWSIQVPLALQAQGVTGTSIPFSLHYLSAFGPMVAALIVTGLTAGRSGLAEFFHRKGKGRLPLGWWGFALAPLILYVLAIPIIGLISGQPPDFQALGEVNFLPDMGIGAFFLWILTFGLGEETGWRGFALPHLQKGRSAMAATLILWVLWAFWHLPLFFYSYRSVFLAGFLIGLLAGAITLTWLYNSTGSIWIPVLFHGAFNFTTACTSCGSGFASQFISAAVMIWAVFVVIRYKPATLSTQHHLPVATD